MSFAQHPQTLKVRPLKRAAEFVSGSVDAEARTIRLSFASAEPVKRYFGKEVLGMDQGECDLSRLNNGAALLLNHDPDCQIGVVVSASIEAGRGYATVRFSSSERAQEIFKDVQEAIRTKVSVGYQVRAMTLTESDETEGDSYRVTDWLPYEISLVSIPADDSVGVGRAADVEAEIPVSIPPKMNRSRILLDALPAAGGGGSSAPAPDMVAALAQRNKDVKEILASAARFNVPTDEALRFIESGKSVADFNAHVLETMGRAKPVSAPSESRDFGDLLKRYSLRRAIMTQIPGNKLDGVEAEVHQELARSSAQAAKGILIPDQALRALTTTAFATGAALVGTQTLGNQYVELLRNRTVIDRLGVRRLAGLTGNVAIPRATGGATAYWLPDSGTVTAADQALGQLGLTPHKLVAATAFSKDLMAQASLDVEGLVRDDLGKVHAIELDRALMRGTGNAGQPQGIVKVATDASSTITFGAAATWQKLLDFESTLATANALLGNVSFVISPATRAKWKNAPKVGSTFPNFLFENQGAFPGDGVVNGYNAVVTNQVTPASTVANQVIFGNFDDAIVATWAGVDLVVDPYSLSTSGQIRIVMTQWADIGIRHAASFVVSTDSGAQ